MSRLRSRRPKNFSPLPGTDMGFSLLQNVQTGSKTHQVFYEMGIGSFLFGLKRPWREANHSPSCSAVLKDNVGYRDKFTFFYYACSCLVTTMPGTVTQTHQNTLYILSNCGKIHFTLLDSIAQIMFAEYKSRSILLPIFASLLIVYKSLAQTPFSVP